MIRGKRPELHLATLQDDIRRVKHVRLEEDLRLDVEDLHLDGVPPGEEMAFHRHLNVDAHPLATLDEQERHFSMMMTTTVMIGMRPDTEPESELIEATCVIEDIIPIPEEDLQVEDLSMNDIV